MANLQFVTAIEYLLSLSYLDPELLLHSFQLILHKKKECENTQQRSDKYHQ